MARARGRHDEVYSSESRFEHGSSLENEDWFGLLLRSPYLLLLVLEGGCLALLWAASPGELQQSRDGPNWWMVLAPAAAIAIFATARFLFWRNAPVLLRAALSLLPILLLLYVVYLR